MGEFDLIERFFKRATTLGAGIAPAAGVAPDEGLALGIGDDCALLQPRPGTQLAISSDMLVEGRHFLSTVDPQALGHKALAVNLSDLAACGAKPLAFTLALALPQADETWLAGFSKGLFELADAHGCLLVGGDTTRGPLNICITVFGEVAVVNGQSAALLRSGAKAGDDLYVSGNLGDARMALEVFRGNLTVSAEAFALARGRMERPTPRVVLGQALRGVATAAIDISDGLLGDLGHILKASGVGATVNVQIATKLVANYDHLTRARAQFDYKNSQNPVFDASNTQFGYIESILRDFALNGGDDYELAFTAPPSARQAVAAAASSAQTGVTRIGSIDAQAGLRLVDSQGQVVPNRGVSFDHFA